MPNGITHRFQLEESISVFKGCKVLFVIFIQVLVQNYASKQWRQNAASDLGLHFLPLSHKKDAWLIWVKMQLFCLSHMNCRNLGSILLKLSSK